MKWRIPFVTNQVFMLGTGVSPDSIFGNWSVCLPWCQHHMVIVTVSLERCLLSGGANAPGIFSFKMWVFFFFYKETMFGLHGVY